MQSHSRTYLCSLSHSYLHARYASSLSHSHARMQSLSFIMFHPGHITPRTNPRKFALILTVALTIPTLTVSLIRNTVSNSLPPSQRCSYRYNPTPVITDANSVVEKQLLDQDSAVAQLAMKLAQNSHEVGREVEICLVCFAFVVMFSQAGFDLWLRIRKNYKHYVNLPISLLYNLPICICCACMRHGYWCMHCDTYNVLQH